MFIPYYDPTEQERSTNEVNACLALTEQMPDNAYWQNRLASALVDEFRAYKTVDWMELYRMHLRRQSKLLVLEEPFSLVTTS